jgi:hypothetical protein
MKLRLAFEGKLEWSSFITMAISAQGGLQRKERNRIPTVPWSLWTGIGCLQSTSDNQIGPKFEG